MSASSESPVPSDDTAYTKLKDLLQVLKIGDFVTLPLLKSPLSTATGGGSASSNSVPSFRTIKVNGGSSEVGSVFVMRDRHLKSSRKHSCCVLHHDFATDDSTVAILYGFGCTKNPGDVLQAFRSHKACDFLIPLPFVPQRTTGIGTAPSPSHPIHALDGRISLVETDTPNLNYSLPTPVWMEAIVAAQAYPVDLPVRRQTPMHRLDLFSIFDALSLAARLDNANPARKYADQAVSAACRKLRLDQKPLRARPPGAGPVGGDSYGGGGVGASGGGGGTGTQSSGAKPVLSYAEAVKSAGSTSKQPTEAEGDARSRAQACRDADCAFLETYDHFSEGAYITTFLHGGYAAKYWAPRTEEEELLGDNDLNWGDEEEEDQDEEAERRGDGHARVATGDDSSSSVAGWLAEISLRGGVDESGGATSP